MRVAIVTATYNKLGCLANTISSITWQETNHDIELCIVDDCSDIDPFYCISKHCGSIPLRYKRLSQNVGDRKSQTYAPDLFSPGIQAVILQSCDTVYGTPDLIQDLVDNLEPGVATMPEVRNLPVQEDLHLHPELLSYYLSDERLVGYPERGHPVFYSGPRQPDPENRWYFFLGAILLEDLNKTCFRENNWDVAIHDSMKVAGLTVKYISGIGIHQKHVDLKRNEFGQVVR